MYIREKRNRSGPYYQAVESVRVEGKPRQRVVLHLGHYETLKEARAGLKRELTRLRKDLEMDKLGARTSPSGEKRIRRLEKKIAGLSEKLSKVEGLLKAS